MIIDGHCHAGKGDALTAPWNTTAPLAAYLKRARRAGIDATIVCPAFHSDYVLANRELSRLIARTSSKLIGFAMVHTSRDAGRIHEMLDEATKRYGFRGVKVHGHDSQATRELCDAARRFNLPIFLDVAGKAHVIDMLAPEYPDVSFIIAHLGSFADDWRAHERVVEQLARYPNIYADTSGVRRFDYLLRAVRHAGPSKLIYGSDGPWLHPALELQKIRLLGLPQSAEAAVLGQNAERLILRRSAPSIA